MERKNSHFVECGGTVTREQLEHRVGEGEIVSSIYTEFFVGVADYYTPYYLMANILTDLSVDTDWGINGYFSYVDPITGHRPEVAYDIFQLEDGRTLIIPNEFRIDAANGDPAQKTVYAIMLDADGVIDITWGDRGFFTVLTSVAYLTHTVRVLQDNDGNFYLFGMGSWPPDGLGYSVYKIDSDGNLLTRGQSGYVGLWAFYDACWADDEKTKILAIGICTAMYRSPPAGWCYANMVMINASDLTRDTTWTGANAKGWGDAGTSELGLAKYPQALYGGSSLYCIRRTSDGGFVLNNLAKNPTTLYKILVDGSNYDTSWGTNGVLTYPNGVAFNTNPSRLVMSQEVDGFYTISYINDGVSKVQISHIDATGVIDKSYSKASTVGDYISIFAINDKLYLANLQNAEIWSTDLVYEDGFTVPNINNLLWFYPDETTRIDTYEFPDETTERWVITTSPDLVGETVKILADGVVLPDQIVNDAGEITFDQPYGEIHWGLGYGSKIRPMRPVTSPEMMASIVTVKQMGISVLNTGAIKVGVSDDDMKDVSFADMKNKCEIEGLFTGTVAVSVPDGFSKNCPLQISTDSPLPCVIRAMIVKLNKTGA